jgi:hypothetical protein
MTRTSNQTLGPRRQTIRLCAAQGCTHPVDVRTHGWVLELCLVHYELVRKAQALDKRTAPTEPDWVKCALVVLRQPGSGPTGPIVGSRYFRLKRRKRYPGQP